MEWKHTLWMPTVIHHRSMGQLFLEFLSLRLVTNFLSKIVIWLKIVSPSSSVVFVSLAKCNRRRRWRCRSCGTPPDRVLGSSWSWSLFFWFWGIWTAAVSGRVLTITSFTLWVCYTHIGWYVKCIRLWLNNWHQWHWFHFFLCLDSLRFHSATH